MTKDEAELIKIVDYILNRAGDREMEVIISAIKKKDNDRRHRLFDPAQNARKMAESVSQQVGTTHENVKHMMRGFISEIIKKNAPEIPEADLEALLNTYMPGEKKKTPKADGALSGEILISMVDQFLAYSTGGMTGTEEAALSAQIPGWPEKYWKAFSPELQELITRFLKGDMEHRDFRTAVLEEAGME